MILSSILDEKLKKYRFLFASNRKVLLLSHKLKNKAKKLRFE